MVCIDVYVGEVLIMKVLERCKPDSFLPEQQKELISVIVAVYNIESYIERGVNSILQQTYRNLEILLVDDGSTDKSGEICDRLAGKDDRIIVLHKENGGLADARNAGLSAAKGSFIGFVDGDDWIDADMYACMIGTILAHQADMAVCRYRRVYKDHTEDDSTDRAVLLEGKEALQYYVEERKEYDIQNAAWNKLYRRNIIEDMRFPTGKWYEDILFTTTALSRIDKCVYLDSAYYNYIIDRDGSIMNTQIGSRLFTDLIPAYQEKTIFLRNLGMPDLADIHDYYIYKRLLLYYNQIKKSRFLGKREYLNKITDVIYRNIDKNGEDYNRVYHCSIANPNEKKKMDLFLISPKLYWVVMVINEAVILPLKIRRCK